MGIGAFGQPRDYVSSYNLSGTVTEACPNFRQHSNIIHRCFLPISAQKYVDFSTELTRENFSIIFILT